jgi:hypothetical protein
VNTLYCLEKWRDKQIISPPVDNFTPRGQNSPLGAKFSPRGEVRNGPLAPGEFFKGLGRTFTGTITLKNCQQNETSDFESAILQEVTTMLPLEDMSGCNDAFNSCIVSLHVQAKYIRPCMHL